MICPNCGAENAQGAPYCYNCANPLPQAGAGTPPGSVPPGGVQPGGVPPGGIPTGGFTPGSVPPGSVPPGGGYVPPGGGYTPGPIKPPKNTFSAGIAALIAFLVVAGIGALLFFTVFHKSKEQVVGPTGPTPVTTTGTGPTGQTGTTTGTTGTTTGTTGTTTGTTGTTTGTTGTTTGTTGTTTGTTGTTTATTTGGNKGPTKTKPPPPRTLNFVVKFCKVPPTESSFAGGCLAHLFVPTGRLFFFVIRTQNAPKGVVFSVNLVIKGTNKSVLDFDTKPTSQGINRLTATLPPAPAGAAGATLVAVIKVNGQAVVCGDHVCTQDESAQVTFT